MTSIAEGCNFDLFFNQPNKKVIAFFVLNEKKVEIFTVGGALSPKSENYVVSLVLNADITD